MGISAWRFSICESKGRIFSHVWPFYERAVSNLDPLRSMHRPVLVAHSSFIEGSHKTKNTASEGELYNSKNVILLILAAEHSLSGGGKFRWLMFNHFGKKMKGFKEEVSCWEPSPSAGIQWRIQSGLIGRDRKTFLCEFVYLCVCVCVCVCPFLFDILL